MTVLDDRRAAAFDRGAGIAVRHRRFASPLDYGSVVMPRMVRTPAIEQVNSALVDVLEGHCERLMVWLSPQEGKSTVTTRFTIGTALTWQPEARWGIASYSDRLARGWSRRIRNDITANSGRNGGPDLGLRLAPDQKAAAEWRLDNGIGGVYSAGVGGSWSGQPLDGLVVDDPHKDRKAAESQTQREDVIDWWESTATARLSSGAPIVIVQTRWHWDDLSGYLLRTQQGEWRVVHIPAQADPAILDPDPLGREPDQFMVSARGRTREQWERRKREAGDEWTPLYQGAPSAPSGSFFRVDALRYWRLDRDGGSIVAGPRSWDLRQCWRFITMDTAHSTAKSADYTVASCWAIPPDDSLVLLDVARDRVPEHRQFDLARPLVERWAPEMVWVESTMHGTQLVREAVQHGWPVGDLRADKSKSVRAATFASRVETGRVWFPAEHPLLPVIVDEMRTFPLGSHDDFVDTGGYAGWVAFQKHVPAGVGHQQVEVPAADPYAGVMGGPVDYDTAQW